jgi:hypothetical protein
MIALSSYLGIVALTFIPTSRAILRKVKLFPGGASFDESPYFSPEGKN